MACLGGKSENARVTAKNKRETNHQDTKDTTVHELLFVFLGALSALVVCS